VQPAEPPAGDGLARGDVPGVEAALEADLHGHARGGRGPHCLERSIKIRGEGLLAEHRHPGRHAAGDQGRVRLGGRGDHQPVQAGLEQLPHRVRGPHAQAGGQAPRPGRVGVGHHQRVDLGHLPQRGGVARPDAPRAGKSDPHATSRSAVGWAPSVLERSMSVNAPDRRPRRIKVSEKSAPVF